MLLVVLVGGLLLWPATHTSVIAWALQGFVDETICHTACEFWMLSGLPCTERRQYYGHPLIWSFFIHSSAVIYCYILSRRELFWEQVLIAHAPHWRNRKLTSLFIFWGPPWTWVIVILSNVNWLNRQTVPCLTGAFGNLWRNESSVSTPSGAAPLQTLLSDVRSYFVARGLLARKTMIGGTRGIDVIWNQFKLSYWADSVLVIFKFNRFAE